MMHPHPHLNASAGYPPIPKPTRGDDIREIVFYGLLVALPLVAFGVACFIGVVHL